MFVVFLLQPAHMIGSLASGATNFLVAKIETKYLAQSIESELMAGFLSSRCRDGHIDLSEMIRSLASGATSSIVTKN